ncbi:MAG: hypothetical protein COA42_01120 [Alteromonadaceae bacterium]|nr:MAG: hypothetical protein COA42_01120 [Alteromonadaceae bacterium]
MGLGPQEEKCMAENIISAAVNNLNRVELLINSLDKEAYADASSGPYYSSVGGHIRHVLDIFTCTLAGFDTGIVDLTKRERGTSAETEPAEGLKYLENVKAGLNELKTFDMAHKVTVVDDIGGGFGKEEVASTIGAALCQAHSHATHHFACIGYLLYSKGITIPDAGFGYNPSTPKPKVST